ncbi:MAG: ABC transporter ATP-binding protein [Chlamydiae bacterium]|nr:ABC transporter ATP-binding protein [Chlamydiota bacterium]MBI3266095.1 ABC transporter ATP-binding protein [Chlamydiota bacterium]
MPLLLEGKNLSKHFHQKGKSVRAVDAVDLTLEKGEVLGIVGESGSGKSTLAKLLTDQIAPSSGEILLEGKRLSSYPRKEKASLIQMVFQDGSSSLDPKMKLMDILTEGWLIHQTHPPKEMQKKILEWLESFQLSGEILNRKPRELSGGQLQRVALARTLSIHPKILIADEPTASLDLALRNQVIQLLRKKVKEMNLSLILISHDLDTVLSLADKIYVMFRGRMLEKGTTLQISKNFIHPYTQRLLQPQKTLIHEIHWNDLSASFEWANACPFNNVCRNAFEKCQSFPPWKIYGEKHEALCHY